MINIMMGEYQCTDGYWFYHSGVPRFVSVNLTIWGTALADRIGKR